MKVSVLTNNFNGSKNIDSFFKSLYAQSFVDWELIFFDNNSTDNSIELVNNYKIKDGRIKLFKNDQFTGLGLARLKALNLCNSDYIAVWDIDDTAHKDRLELQYNFLNLNTDIDLVCSNVIKLTNGKSYNYYINPSSEYIKSQLVWHNIIVHSSVMYKKEIALKIGGYDPNYNYSQDYNFYINFLINNYKISSIDKYLCYQSINHEGLSMQKNMKKTIYLDQINNLIKARKIKKIKFVSKFLNYIATYYYLVRILFVK